jgi:hypothetical protein
MVKFKEVFRVVRVEPFFRKYASSIRNQPHKWRGVDGNGKPITYTDADRREIVAAIGAFIADLQGLAAELQQGL